VLQFDLSRDLKIRYIYNLLSNFGNISFICKKNKKAYIKFRTIEFAAIARTYLNERSLMGNLLLLNYPPNPEDGIPKESEFC
jgi:RNA recognition motif-containing protein